MFIKFHEWLKNKDPFLLDEMDRRDFMKYSALGLGGLAGASAMYKGAKKIGYEIFTPDSIKKQNPENLPYIVKKPINVFKWIHRAVLDKAKFVSDFENLKPGSDLSIGQETRKKYFDRDVMLYVVPHEAIEKAKPGSWAYASPGRKNKGGDWIVMPEDAFSVLPTQTTDGELTKDGAQTLAHELRHTTQDHDTTKDRNQGTNISLKDKKMYDKYMQDPKEMGVRLASTKNMMNRDALIENILAKPKNFVVYRASQDPKTKNVKPELVQIPVEDLRKMLSEALPSDEKELFKFFYTDDPSKLVRAVLKSPTFLGMLEKYKDDAVIPGEPDLGIQSMRKILGMLRDEKLESYLGKNNDAKSLYYFWKKLPSDMKSKYFQELWNGYDTVVKGYDMASKLYSMT